MRRGNLFALVTAMAGDAAMAFAQTTPTHHNTAAEDRAAQAACGACAGVMMLIPLAFLVISVVLAVWVYKDATKRGDPQAAIWALVAFLFSFVGLLIYIVVRSKNEGRTPPMPPPPPSYTPPPPPPSVPPTA